MDYFRYHVLSFILFEPLAGALLILLISKKNENAIRWVANLTALVGFAISIPLWFWFDPKAADFQLIDRATWVPSVGADYFLGVSCFITLLHFLRSTRTSRASLSPSTRM